MSIGLGIVGLLLFAYFVRKAGLTEIVGGIRRLGLGFILILLISSLRYSVRSISWIKCIEEPYQLPFRDAFAARLMGDALGNIIPFVSVAVAEPSKAVFVKHRVPFVVGLSALAIEHILYGLSVALFIFAGTATLLLSFSLPRPLHIASIGALIAIVVTVPLGFLIIRFRVRVLSGAIDFLGKRGVTPRLMEKLKPRVATLEDRVYGFYQRDRRSFIPIFVLEILFHLAGVLEIYTTLFFISPLAPSWRQAFILESVNRIINVVFKFIPLRTGVDEGGTGQVSKVLGLTQAMGVTLAIIRKGREIFWSALGVALLLRRGFSLTDVGQNATDEIGKSHTTAVVIK